MRIAVLLTIGALAAACGRDHAEARMASSAPAAQASAAAPIPHGDHNPHFGGIVLMNGDLHFEVVMRRTGEYRVYFSDAVRAELPAATASDVTMTVTEKGRGPETIRLSIDEGGESWIGHGRAIEAAEATARVAYSFHGEPYFIDVPVPR